MTITAAIDPGITGSICISGEPIVLHDMPVIEIHKKPVRKGAKAKIKREVDVPRLLSILREAGVGMVLIEEQQERPARFSTGKDADGVDIERKQGVSSSWTTAKNYYLIVGALIGADISQEAIHPKTWQAAFKISGNSKGQSCQIAERLYPGASFRGPRGRALDGRADAALLLEYGRRNGITS